MVPHFAVVVTIRDVDQFSSANFESWQFPRAYLEVGTDLFICRCLCRCFCCHRAVRLSLVRQGCRIFIFRCCRFQRFVALPDNSGFICLPPSVRKAIGQRFSVREFSFKHSPSQLKIYFDSEQAPCLSEEQKQEKRLNPLFTTYEFWVKKSRGTPQLFFVPKWKLFMTKTHVRRWHLTCVVISCYLKF